jgi:hypothetical protein
MHTATRRSTDHQAELNSLFNILLPPHLDLASQLSLCKLLELPAVIVVRGQSMLVMWILHGLILTALDGDDMMAKSQVTTGVWR